MSLQERTHNPADAHGAFTSTNKPEITAMAETERLNRERERQERQRIFVQSITERKIAKSIAKSKTPIIIITDASARAYGNLHKRLNDILPNIPVVFENEDAQQEFKKAPFCISSEFNHRIIGHFVRIDDFQPNGLCAEIKKSDCIIVFGKPQKDLARALERHCDYITGDTVNLSLIDMMKRNKDNWKTWNKHLQQRPSL